MRTYQQGDQVFIDYEAYKTWYEATYLVPFDLPKHALVFAVGEPVFQHEGEAHLDCYWGSSLTNGSTNATIPVRFIKDGVYIVVARHHGDYFTLGVFTDPDPAIEQARRLGDKFGATYEGTTGQVLSLYAHPPKSNESPEVFVDLLELNSIRMIDEAIARPIRMRKELL